MSRRQLEYSLVSGETSPGTREGPSRTGGVGACLKSVIATEKTMKLSVPRGARRQPQGRTPCSSRIARICRTPQTRNSAISAKVRRPCSSRWAKKDIGLSRESRRRRRAEMGGRVCEGIAACGGNQRQGVNCEHSISPVTPESLAAAGRRSAGPLQPPRMSGIQRPVRSRQNR
jgi:hypothetical protein